MNVIRFTILGEPASKANSRQLVNFGDRPAIIKSKKARDYERTAALQIPPEARQMIEGPVRVTLRIFYASERPDLDESVILDVLQARYKKVKGALVKIAEGQYAHAESACVLVSRGVYLNDRQVREKHVYHAIDRANPRAEIEVEALQAQQTTIEGWPFPAPRTAEQQLASKPF